MSGIGIALCLSFTAILVGWVWLIFLSLQIGGWEKAFSFFTVGFMALIWGYRMWRQPDSGVNTGIPTFLMSVGLAMVIITVVIASIW